MSRLIRNQEFKQTLTTDDWLTLADDTPCPAAGKVIVSLARWRAERTALEAAAIEVGVQAGNTEDILAAWPELAARPLIALQFPTSSDGRAFSQARLLRERCGYRGEIRATGEVLRDQLQYMQRCGFDSFVPRADQDLESCLRAFTDFDLAYQRAADQATPVWMRRRA